MHRLCLLLTATIYIFYCLPQSEGSQKCNGKNHRLTISINGKRNSGGEWVTCFSASQNTSVLPNSTVLDLTRAATECHGNHIVNIQGIIKDTSSENVSENACEIFSENKIHRLFFHDNCSSNAVITNNGRTLQRKKVEAAALTNRPLRDNEIFTIRLDKRGTGNYAFGIGITTHSPTTLDLPNHMNHLKSGTWMFYGSSLFQNGDYKKKNFLKTSLDSVKVGQHIGVMRTKSGKLHFFLDGLDQGPAASNISDDVYGAFELSWSGLQGTIID